MAINFHSPWVIGGAAVGLVALLLLMRGGSAGGSAVASQQSADAANVQLAGQSTALQLNADNLAAANTIEGTKANAYISAAVLSLIGSSNNNAAALATTQTQVNGAVAMHADTTNATMVLAPELARISADSSQALATTAAGEAVNLAQINSTTAITNTAAYVGVAPTLAQISANSQQALATITGNTATTVAGINASAATSIAGINSSGATDRQLAASGGSILGGLAQVGSLVTSFL